MKKITRSRVILDTNIWISCLIWRRLYSLQQLLTNDEIEVVVCSKLIKELKRVTFRPKLSKYFSEELLELLWSYIEHDAIFYEIGDAPSRCRDVKDDYLLELAIVSNANFLISGDKDLLDIEKIGICNIVTAAEYDIIAKSMGSPTTLHEDFEEYFSIIIK